MMDWVDEALQGVHQAAKEEAALELIQEVGGPGAVWMQVCEQASE